MKKLLACLCVVTLLAGCGGSGNKSESKTCSITQNGMTLDATFNAKDDEIKTADMNVTVPASALGGVDLSTLSDDQKKMMQTQLESSLGIKEDDGMKVSFDFKDKDIVVKINMDLTKTDSSSLKKFGFGSNTDMSLKNTVEQAEKQGATCK